MCVVGQMQSVATDWFGAFCEPQTMDMNVAGWHDDYFIPAAIGLLLLMAAWRTVLRLRPGYTVVFAALTAWLASTDLHPVGHTTRAASLKPRQSPRDARLVLTTARLCCDTAGRPST